MTREEAVLLLIAAEEKLLDGFYKGEFYVEEGMGKAFEMAIEAIVGKQPDTETGLMPCGCGGKVAIAKYPGFLDTPDLYQVDCFECFVGTKPTMSPERARIAWNKAMGYTDPTQEQ